MLKSAERIDTLWAAWLNAVTPSEEGLIPKLREFREYLESGVNIVPNFQTALGEFDSLFGDLGQ